MVPASHVLRARPMEEMLSVAGREEAVPSFGARLTSSRGAAGVTIFLLLTRSLHASLFLPRTLLHLASLLGFSASYIFTFHASSAVVPRAIKLSRLRSIFLILVASPRSFSFSPDLVLIFCCLKLSDHFFCFLWRLPGHFLYLPASVFIFFCCWKLRYKFSSAFFLSLGFDFDFLWCLKLCYKFSWLWGRVRVHLFLSDLPTLFFLLFKA